MRLEVRIERLGAQGDGVALQRMEAHAYLAWKRELTIAALASRGLETPVEEVRASACR
jgi:hypothetical protein